HPYGSHHRRRLPRKNRQPLRSHPGGYLSRPRTGARPRSPPRSRQRQTYGHRPARGSRWPYRSGNAAQGSDLNPSGGRMAFSALRGASSGLLAVFKNGPRLRKRRKAKSQPALPTAAEATPNTIASLAPLTKIISQYLDPKDVERVKEAYRFSDQAHLGQF